MEEKNYLQDLKEIKELMSKSSQFISLSGISGVLAGVYALIGAYFVHFRLANTGARIYISLRDPIFLQMMIVAFIVLIAAFTTAFILTQRKAKRNNECVWGIASINLLINFLIPLITGGLFCIMLISKGYFALIASSMLVFYGLACINCSKYTFRNIRYLGFAEIILGLASIEFSGYGLYFWALGFGVLHIVYGASMYFKYDRK